MRQVVIHPGEDGYWIAECPSLPGCITQGKTREEALENAKEAIQGYIAALEDDGLPVPEEHFDTILVCTVFNHHPACNPHGNSASGNRRRTAAESSASVSPGWLAGSTFKTARRMARYFLASTARALPGWLTFSTAIRMLALGLPFGNGRCSETCRFLDRVTFLSLSAWGVLRVAVPNAGVVTMEISVRHRLRALWLTDCRITLTTAWLPHPLRRRGLVPYHRHFRHAEFARSQCKPSQPPRRATDDSCKALTKAARAGRLTHGRSLSFNHSGLV